MDSGYYQLLIRLPRDAKIRIGALGEILFKKGYYVYTGSALKNLGKRLERHNKKEKTLRWHIDYLLADPSAKIIEYRIYPANSYTECQLNIDIYELPGASVPCSGFGSSDCGNCPAHLIKISNKNDFWCSHGSI